MKNVIWDPRTTPNFTRAEMACKCGCGQCEMRHDFMDQLQAYRNRVGPLTVNSGYRCPNHPREVLKDAPGPHAQGRAADMVWPACGKHEALRVAFVMGVFKGVGWEGDFLHLDNGHDYKHRPAAWRY